MHISVIIPVYNEEDNLPIIYQKLTEVMQKLQKDYELVFVNDGSKDKSIQIIGELTQKDSCVKFIDFSRNFGHQIAVSAGIDYALGEYIVIIDADLQDPPELIIDLYNKACKGYEVVYAQRIKRNGESFLKKWTAKMFYRLLKKVTSINMPVDTGDFRIIHRKIAEVIKKMPERQKFLRGQIAWAGFKQTAVEYQRAERLHGTTKYTYKKMINLAIDAISGFSTAPLKIATIGGFIASIFAFILILYTLYSKFFTNTAEPGWASLEISILFIGGIQLIGIGIIGEYLARVSENVKDRPLYIINQTNFDSKESVNS